MKIWLHKSQITSRCGSRIIAAVSLTLALISPLPHLCLYSILYPVILRLHYNYTTHIVQSVLFTVRYYRDYIVLFEVSLPHQPVIHTITHHHLEELYYCGVCSAGKWVAMQLRFQQQRENAPQQTSCNKLINKSWRFMLSGVRCTFNNKAVASYCRSLRMNAEKPAGKSTSSELLYLMCKLCSVSCWLADRLFIYLLLLIWWCA